MSTWKSPAMPAVASALPALFLDRDGVIIADENYLADPRQVRILPGVPSALATARSAGFLLIGVSNQSGIGRGYFSAQDFHAVMTHLDTELESHGAAFDSFHFCPHGPDEGCSCRKPAPGLLEEASQLQAIDLSRSWMIGDKASDIVFGREAGMGAVLVRTGYGRKQEKKVLALYPGDPLVQVADDLPAAVAWILARTERT